MGGKSSPLRSQWRVSDVAYEMRSPTGRGEARPKRWKDVKRAEIARCTRILPPPPPPCLSLHVEIEGRDFPIRRENQEEMLKEKERQKFHKSKRS